MGILDLFRSDRPGPENPPADETRFARQVRSANDPAVAAEALTHITHLAVLKDLLMTEPTGLSDGVRRLVADRVAGAGFLRRFLKRYADEPVAIQAIRLTGNMQALGEVLSDCAELPQTIRTALLQSLDDPAELARALGRVSTAKLQRRLVGEIPPAMSDRLLAHADEKLVPHLLQRLGKESRLKEIAETGSPAVRKAAIALISDREFLRTMQKTSADEGTRNSLAARLEATRPIYFEYRAHTECPECVAPVILNGPVLKAQCDSCGSVIRVSRDYWQRLFRASNDNGVFIRGERIGVQPGVQRPPHCPDCGSALDTDELETGKEAFIECTACNRQHLSFPAPSWLRGMEKGQKKPVQIYCAEKENTPGLTTGEARPIAFACINCGGGLELTAAMPRVVTCKYCSSQQFLPGALWHALHPATKKRAWYIRYE